MPSKIGQRYGSLARALELKDGVPGFTLIDEAIPVVILHDHCEGDSFGNSATASGAVGAQDLVILPAPRSGAYQVAIYCDWSVSVVASETMAWRLRSTGGGNQRLLRYLVYGQAGNQAGHFFGIIPKVHVDEGWEFVARQESAIAINDIITMGLFIQPL